MRSLLAALLVVVAKTHGPVSAFVLKAPRIFKFSPNTQPLSRRAGLCEWKPPVLGAVLLRNFLEPGKGGSQRGRHGNAALHFVVPEGGGLTMAYRDSGTRLNRRSSNQNRGEGLLSPRLARALPVPYSRGARVCVNVGSGGHSYGEISGSWGTNGANSNSGTSTSTGSSSTSGEATGGLNTAFPSKIPSLGKSRSLWWKRPLQIFPLQVFQPRDLTKFLIVSNLKLRLGAPKSRYCVFLDSNDLEEWWEEGPALKAPLSRGLRGSLPGELPWTVADAFDDEISAAVAKAQLEMGVKLAGITDPLDKVYAVMPRVQEILKERIGWEGFGAGYENTRVGFYQDSNLQPLNWRDAVVSMKPGSGTIGLNPDLDNYAGTPADVQRRRRQRAKTIEMLRAAEEAKDAAGKPVALVPSPEMPRTRHGGPAPGTHGPWRWGQLTKGSPLERRLRAEVASFPPRLQRRTRRYFDDKVVWITGADHGLGEQLAINLTVNGARVILSGMDFYALERVQRLCILAWMKAVDWEAEKASRDGLNRLDRVMVNPLDVRDDFALEDARVESERMLGRPMDMVFHCQIDSGGAGGDRDSEDKGEEDEEEESREECSDHAPPALETALLGAVELTKVLLPTMLDRQEGHVVVLGSDSPFSAPPKSKVPSAEGTAPQYTTMSYFDNLRDEVARDHIKVTMVHQGHQHNGYRRHALEQRSNRGAAAAEGSTSATAIRPPPVQDTRIAARRVLTAVARGQPDVSIFRRRVFGVARLGI